MGRSPDSRLSLLSAPSRPSSVERLALSVGFWNYTLNTYNLTLVFWTVAFSRFQCRLQLRGSNGLTFYALRRLHRFPCFRS
ncbi:protein of unknown function [Candidatus Methylomirabilis oxygeniifera]|uniref:Uncharacterized protein n=1 Tax=Methylomirabilis oxygeniifera TaxID=671143 RepID=D5MHB0_METO1|nr:protein of unknown function [Candidatus Methylomirabilis oxyfera]